MMRCPVCKSVTLERQELESALPTQRCTACGGHWVQSSHYWRWLDEHPHEPATAEPAVQIESLGEDSKAGKLCPECGTFLIRHRAESDLPFHLDHCGRCAGVWFDAHEWEVLRSRNLHDRMHYIFSDAWQARIRLAERKAAEHKRLLERLGHQTMQRLEEIKQWLDAHPHGSELYAYLLNEREQAPAPERLPRA